MKTFNKFMSKLTYSDNVYVNVLVACVCVFIIVTLASACVHFYNMDKSIISIY